MARLTRISAPTRMPAIILAAGVIHFISVAFGPHGGVLLALREARARRARLLQSMKEGSQ